jgi:magnesium transporter
MAVRKIKQDKLTWHYLTEFDGPELEFLKNNFKFHPLDLKDCAGEPQRSKIDIYKNYLFLVLQLPIYDVETNRVAIDQMYIFVGKNYLVTVTKGKMKFLNNLYFKIVHNQPLKEHIFSQDAGYLLYRILDYVLRGRWKNLNVLDQKIRNIESDIEEGKGKKVVFNVAALRRILLRFRSIVDPQRSVVNSLSRLEVNFINKEMTVYFDDVDDYIEKLWFALESYRDRILSLYEINESLISYRTNRIITLLTVFSGALLPLTLLAGIYGMNIALPFDQSPHLVWGLFVLLVLVVGGIFLLLKKKDWI